MSGPTDDLKELSERYAIDQAQVVTPMKKSGGQRWDARELAKGCKSTMAANAAKLNEIQQLKLELHDRKRT